jgi:hypothetical protein
MPIEPGWIVHLPQVIPQGGDKALLADSPARPTSVAGFAVIGQRGMECQFTARSKTCGMNSYVLTLQNHIHSLLRPQGGDLLCNPLHPEIGKLHQSAALLVQSSGIPAETLLILHPQPGLQGDPFLWQAFSTKPHFPNLHRNQVSQLLLFQGNAVEADQLQKSFEQVGRVLILRVSQIGEIIGLR